MWVELENLDNCHRCIICERPLSGQDSGYYARSMKNSFLKYKKDSEERRRRLEAEWEGRKSKKSDGETVVAATCGDLFHKACLMKYCSNYFSKSKGILKHPLDNFNPRANKASCPRCKRHIMYSLHQEIDLEGHRMNGLSPLEKEFNLVRITNQELQFQFKKEIAQLESLENSISIAKAKLDAARKKQTEMHETFPKDAEQKMHRKAKKMEKKRREKKAMEAYIEKAQKVIEVMQSETPKVMRMYLGSVKRRPLDEIAGCTPIPRMLIPHLNRISGDDYCLFALSQIVRPQPYPGTTFDFNSLITGILNKVNPTLIQRLVARTKQTSNPDLGKAYEQLFPMENCLEMLRSVRELGAESDEEIDQDSSKSAKPNSDLEITIMYVLDEDGEENSEKNENSEIKNNEGNWSVQKEQVSQAFHLFKSNKKSASDSNLPSGLFSPSASQSNLKQQHLKSEDAEGEAKLKKEMQSFLAERDSKAGKIVRQVSKAPSTLGLTKSNDAAKISSNKISLDKSVVNKAIKDSDIENGNVTGRSESSAESDISQTSHIKSCEESETYEPVTSDAENEGLSAQISQESILAEEFKNDQIELNKLSETIISSFAKINTILSQKVKQAASQSRLHTQNDADAEVYKLDSKKLESDSDSDGTGKATNASTFQMTQDRTELQRRLASMDAELKFNEYFRDHQIQSVFLDDSAFAATLLNKQISRTSQTSSNFNSVASAASKTDPTPQVSTINSDASQPASQVNSREKSLEEMIDSWSRVTGHYYANPTTYKKKNPLTFNPIKNPCYSAKAWDKMPKVQKPEGKRRSSELPTPSGQILNHYFQFREETPPDFLDLKVKDQSDADALNNNNNIEVMSELANNSDVFVTVMAAAKNKNLRKQDGSSFKSIPYKDNLHMVAYGKSVTKSNIENNPKQASNNPMQTLEEFQSHQRLQGSLNPVQTQQRHSPQPYATTTYINPSHTESPQQQRSAQPPPAFFQYAQASQRQQQIVANQLPPPTIQDLPHKTSNIQKTQQKSLAYGASALLPNTVPMKRRNPFRMRNGTALGHRTIIPSLAPLTNMDQLFPPVIQPKKAFPKVKHESVSRPNASKSRSKSSSKMPLINTETVILPPTGAYSGLLSNAELGNNGKNAAPVSKKAISMKPMTFMMESEKPKAKEVTKACPGPTKVINCRKASFPKPQATSYQAHELHPPERQALEQISQLCINLSPRPSKGNYKSSLKKCKGHSKSNLVSRSVKTLKGFLTPRNSCKSLTSSVGGIQGSSKEDSTLTGVFSIGQSPSRSTKGKSKSSSVAPGGVRKKGKKSSWKSNPFSARGKK